MSVKSCVPLFASSAVAVFAAGCSLENPREFECKSADGARVARVDSRLSTSVLTTTDAGVEETYYLSRYRGTGLEQIRRQAVNFCERGITPPGYTR